MPESQPGSPTPTERFDRLWEEIGAKRIVIGDADKGVEITVDADLSIFGILDKLKEAARSGHEEGAISDAEEKAIARTLEDTARTLSGSIQDKLRAQVERLTKKQHK
jgi:hypothetical protein